MTAVESRPAGVLGESRSSSHRPFGARVKAFVALTKPRIIELLLITTVPVMFLAQQGVPDLGLVLLTCIGGYLSAGGANRSGGTTSGVVEDDPIQARARKLTPDA